MHTPSIPYIDANRAVYTGRPGTGKDFVAGANHDVVLAYSDPIKQITEFFLGSADKSKTGVRRFMQKVGAWGRGIVNEEYPLTPTRHRVCGSIRSNYREIFDLEALHLTDTPEDVFASFGVGGDLTEEDAPGRTPVVSAGDFWLELMAARVEQVIGRSDDRHAVSVGITGARYPDEAATFTGLFDFTHRHVMCSDRTRKRRLGRRAEEMSETEKTDETESLARELDAAAVAGGVANGDVAVFSVRKTVCRVTGQEDSDLLLAEWGINNNRTLSGASDLDPVLEDVVQGRSVVWNDDPERMPDEFDAPDARGKELAGAARKFKRNTIN